MSVFRDANQFYDTVGELMNYAKMDKQVGSKIAASGIVIQFRYTDPEAVTTVNAKDKPTQPGAYVDVTNGPSDLNPDVTLSMKADVAHAFWHGKVNLMGALAKRDIVAQGPMAKVLKLLPAVEPLYKVYPNLLRERGYPELVMK